VLSRRDFLQVTAATAAMFGGGSNLSALAAKQKIAYEDLVGFDSLGQVTLLNFADCHAQLQPLYYREPSVNIGVGKATGVPPHVTGKNFLKHFKLKPGSKEAYAFSSDNFVRLSQEYGRVGGFAHMAKLVKDIRAARPGKTLLIDNGDTWQGSYTSLQTRGEDMVRVQNALGVDAMTAHWEFTYGEKRVRELIKKLKFPFLAGNITDTEWEEPVFKSTAFFERGGVKIAVIGQAFPYTPIANPRYLIPKWSFGIKEDKIRQNIAKARRAGADVIVLASQDGFDVEVKLATRVKGIDVLLTSHTHDAVPAVIRIGDTLMVASGSHGKFLARLDLEIKNKRVAGYRFKLIPVFSDAIPPDAEMAALIKDIRAPVETKLNRVVGRTEGLLYRRGNFNGTFDDLICQAIMEQRDVQIAFSPGFRWGACVMPGHDIRVEDVYNHTAITYAACTRNTIKGEFIKTVLEDVGDNLFNVDPYYQQGGDMVRVGGLGYTMDVSKPMGSRVSDMTLLATGEAIEASKNYVVGGWASVNEGAKGPPIYDVVSRHIEKHKNINMEANRAVKIKGA
jgi:sulfur-oxidizing protein SoxB